MSRPGQEDTPPLHKSYPSHPQEHGPGGLNVSAAALTHIYGNFHALAAGARLRGISPTNVLLRPGWDHLNAREKDLVQQILFHMKNHRDFRDDVKGLYRRNPDLKPH
jgi:hypothetical protein